MPVTKVLATLDNKSIDLSNMGNGDYSGQMKAPDVPGTHHVEIAVYDDTGAVSLRNASFIVISDRCKTNWTALDRFNYSDYNRIRGNLYSLWQRSCQFFGYIEIVDMGSDINTYEGFWDVNYFNAWEANLETLDKHMLSVGYGQRQVFFENGPFIRWDELNRIEGAIFDMNDMLDRLEAGLDHLAFRLGNHKEVKI